MEVTTRAIVDPVQLFQHTLCPQDLVRNINFQEDIRLILKDGCLEAPFVFEVCGPFYNLWSVAMALILFCLPLVRLPIHSLHIFLR